MNKSEIAERAAREIWCMQAGFPLGELPETLNSIELSEIELFKGIVERAIAESQETKGEENMHPIWQRGQACIGGKLVDKTCAEMSNQELADFVTEGAWRSDKSAPDQTAYQEAAKRLRELGDGEPSPDYKEFDDYDSFRSKHPRLYKFWNEYDEVLGIDPIWLKFALRFAESGAAQEVSPPSPEPVCPMCCKPVFTDRAEGDTRELKAALATIEENDSSCECDDHTQPECCANVPVSDCFCARCIAGKALL
jgi:hypothetical protein